MGITVKTLADVPDQVLADCFNEAFSDYAIRMSFTAEQFRRVMDRSGMDKELSAGAFEGERMVGFIFNSFGTYRGRKSGFDCGTAVTPGYRRQGIFKAMFSFVLDKMRQRGAQAYVLESLQENDTAVSAYRKQGFRVSREFLVLSAELNQETELKIENVKECPYAGFEIPGYGTCADPSFEHSTEILRRQEQTYNVAYTGDPGKETAFCVFTSGHCNAVQYGGTDLGNLRDIFAYLLKSRGSVYIKNLDAKCTDVYGMLKELGFEEVTRQYEMQMDL